MCVPVKLLEHMGRKKIWIGNQKTWVLVLTLSFTPHMNMLGFHFLFCRRDPSFLISGSVAVVKHHDAVRGLRRAVPMCRVCCVVCG